MRFTVPELETIRTKPSSHGLDLFIFQPRTVMKCLVNNSSIARGARTIAFDTVSSGSYSAVEAGMTLLVGTTDGGKEIGRIRIKSATSSQFEVSENSNIAWADNLYLTVLRYWEVWPVFPRIIQNPSNDEDVIFYKDYDIAYTNQNSILGTFINAGSHRPVLLQNGSGSTYYTSTGTYNLLGESLTYNWAFEGGTPTGSTSATPGNVIYTTAGDYATRLTVTSSSGAVDTTYRYVSVRNKIGQGSSTPIQKWTMSNLSGSRGEAGYSAEFQVFDSISVDDNALVMLRTDDWYGTTNSSPDGNIFFVGYIESGSIKYNYRDSSFTFRASSVTRLMKDSVGFSISVESSGSPSRWFELLDLDAKRAIYHYLKWQSTVLSVTDFAYRGHDYKIQYFDADRTSIFEAVDGFLKMTVPGSLCSDRQGRLFAEADPEAYPNPTGSFTSVMDITRRDWMNEPSIDEAFTDTVSYMELGGIAYSGVYTGTYSAFMSEAPGETPNVRGNLDKRQGLAIEGQNQINTLSGNLFANKNYQYPNVRMDMSTPPRNLDIAPQEAVLVSILASDTVRGISLNGTYIPDRITWQYHPSTRSLMGSMEMRSLVNGIPGTTLEIPPTPSDPVSGFTSNGFNFGGIKIPSFSMPYPYYPLPSSPNSSLPSAVCGMSSNYGFFYTRNFGDTNPLWYLNNSGITEDSVYMQMCRLVVAPNGKIFLGAYFDGTGGVNSDFYRVYVLDSLGGTWRKILDKDVLGGTRVFLDLFVNPNSEEGVCVIARRPQLNPDYDLYLGDSSGFSFAGTIAPTTFLAANYAFGHFSGGEIHVYAGTWNGASYRLTLYRRNPDGSAISSVDLSAIEVANTIYGNGVRGTDKVILHSGNPQNYRVFSNLGTVLVDTGMNAIAPFANTTQPVAVSPSGNFIMGTLDNAQKVAIKSGDGGVTWNTGTFGISGSYVWEDCGDDYRFIYGGGTRVWYTPDFGVTKIDKRGSMTGTMASIDIEGLRYIE